MPVPPFQPALTANRLLGGVILDDRSHVHKRFKQYVEVNRVKRSMGSSSMSQAKIDRTFWE